MRDLDKARTVAVLPVGAVEAHGPHLPLATDVVIAEAMALSGAERLAAAGWKVLLMPALAYTPAPFGRGFPGTIAVREETATTVVTDIAASLGRHGVRLLALANAHLDPANLSALHAAVAARRATDAVTIVFPDISRKPWAGRLTDEFTSGACHAGRYEGSVVLAAAPALVREDAMRALAPNPRSLSAAIREGKRTFEEAGGSRAYFGYPAGASAEEGRQTIETLGAILYEAVTAAVRATGESA